MKVETIQEGKADIEAGRPIDDSLTLTTTHHGAQFACRHCKDVTLIPPCGIMFPAARLFHQPLATYSFRATSQQDGAV
jgi:hypothetical protein